MTDQPIHQGFPHRQKEVPPKNFNPSNLYPVPSLEIQKFCGNWSDISFLDIPFCTMENGTFTCASFTYDLKLSMHHLRHKLEVRTKGIFDFLIFWSFSAIFRSNFYHYLNFCSKFDLKMAEKKQKIKILKIPLVRTSSLCSR